VFFKLIKVHFLVSELYILINIFKVCVVLMFFESVDICSFKHRMLLQEKVTQFQGKKAKQ